MPRLLSYPKQQLPDAIAWQIRSYLRMQWPHLDTGEKPSPEAATDRMTFVLVEDELLISHAEVNFHQVELDGASLRIGGLSAVFTYPVHRGRGSAERVVSAATDYLRGSGVPFSLLFCGERVRSLYLRAGWEHLPAMRIVFGDRALPRAWEEASPNGIVMTLFTTRAPELRAAMTSSPIYVGPATW